MKIYIPLIDSWHFTVISPQRILACEGLFNDYCYHGNRGNCGNPQYQAFTVANKSERNCAHGAAEQWITDLCEDDRHRFKNTASVSSSSSSSSSSSAVSSSMTFNSDLGKSVYSLRGSWEMYSRARRHPLTLCSFVLPVNAFTSLVFPSLSFK